MIYGGFGLPAPERQSFGNYYQYLVKRGLKGRQALMAVMRKLLICAYSLLKSGDTYDPQKVWAGAGSTTTSNTEKAASILAKGAIGA